METERPTRESDERDRYGGYQQVAEVLSREFGEEVSRQGVYQWWRRRARNGFPEGERVERRYPSGAVTSRRRFYLPEVIEWRRGYVPRSGVAKRAS